MNSKFNTTPSPDIIRLKKVFYRFSFLGEIERPTKKGLLLIAKKGAESWRQWQSAFPQKFIDFRDTNFSNYRINFSNFKFTGKEIYFDRSVFENAQFHKCRFEANASFKECEFRGRSSFGETSFIKKVIFEKSSFENPDFSKCLFARQANFRRCRFGIFSMFYEVKFKEATAFTDSSFSSGLNFTESEFSSEVFFCNCKFQDGAYFRNTKFNFAEFTRSIFYGRSDFSCQSDSKNKSIQTISFAGAVFYGKVSFENRQFDGASDFGSMTDRGSGAVVNSKFNSAPLFHGSKIHQDTNFSGAIFKDIPGQESARAYRTLKLAMEQLKATREEQRFFRLEMKAERPSLSFPRRTLSLLYEWLSDYGFSIRRPLAWLLVFSLTIGGAHGLLANAWASQADCTEGEEIKCATSCQRTSDVLKYVLANAAPVPGLDKMQTELRKPLFGEHGLIAATALFLEVAHKIVTLVMAFLFALGLRNLFKMKS